MLSYKVVLFIFIEFTETMWSWLYQAAAVVCIQDRELCIGKVGQS